MTGYNILCRARIRGTRNWGEKSREDAFSETFFKQSLAPDEEGSDKTELKLPVALFPRHQQREVARKGKRKVKEDSSEKNLAHRAVGKGRNRGVFSNTINLS